MRNLSYFFAFLICFNSFGKLPNDLQQSFLHTFHYYIDRSYEVQGVDRLYPPGIHSDTRDIRDIYFSTYKELKTVLENEKDPVDLNLFMQGKISLNKAQKHSFYRIMFRSVRENQFENLVFLSIVLEKNKAFDLNQESPEDANHFNSYPSLISALAHQWARAQGLKEPFRVLLSLHFILEKIKSYQSKSYLNKDFSNQTALMRAVKSLYFRTESETHMFYALSNDDIKNRFEKLLYLFLDYELKPAYFEIKYVLDEFPHLRKTVFTALRKYNYLKHQFIFSPAIFRTQLTRLRVRAFQNARLNRFLRFSKK